MTGLQYQILLALYDSPSLKAVDLYLRLGAYSTGHIRASVNTLIEQGQVVVSDTWKEHPEQSGRPMNVYDMTRAGKRALSLQEAKLDNLRKAQ